MFDNPEKLFFFFVIALLLFGPSKLASLGSSLGRSIRDFRSAVRGAHDEFRAAVQEHVDSITPALPSPESLSLDTSMHQADYGTAMSTPAADAAEGAAYTPPGDEAAFSAAAGSREDAAGAAPDAVEDDPASLASEPTAEALRESLSR